MGGEATNAECDPLGAAAQGDWRVERQGAAGYVWSVVPVGDGMPDAVTGRSAVR